jgi:hypothetical protein
MRHFAKGPDMAVVIQQLDVETQPAPPPVAPPPVGAVEMTGIDETALATALQRQAWRSERLLAD